MKTATEPGTTSYITFVFIQDSTATDGSGKTALTFANITAYYVRSGGVLTQLVPETIATLGTWAVSGNNALGFKLLNNTNAPGLYELHLPNNILAAGANEVVVQLRATGAAPCNLEIQLADMPAPTGATASYTVSKTTVGTSPEIDLVCQQYMALGPFTITASSSQTGDSHTLLVYNPSAPATVLWSLTTAAGEISAAGTTITISDTDTHTGTAGTWAYRLINTSDDAEICRGALIVQAGPNVPTP
jgi:hypothetical protein